MERSEHQREMSYVVRILKKGLFMNFGELEVETGIFLKKKKLFENLFIGKNGFCDLRAIVRCLLQHVSCQNRVFEAEKREIVARANERRNSVENPEIELNFVEKNPNQDATTTAKILKAKKENLRLNDE